MLESSFFSLLYTFLLHNLLNYAESASTSRPLSDILGDSDESIIIPTVDPADEETFKSQINLINDLMDENAVKNKPLDYHLNIVDFGTLEKYYKMKEEGKPVKLEPRKTRSTTKKHVTEGTGNSTTENKKVKLLVVHPVFYTTHTNGFSFDNISRWLCPEKLQNNSIQTVTTSEKLPVFDFNSTMTSDVKKDDLLKAMKNAEEYRKLYSHMLKSEKDRLNQRREVILELQKEIERAEKFLCQAEEMCKLK